MNASKTLKKNKKVRLTRKEIIDNVVMKMNNGYELGYYNLGYTAIWIQEGGIGKGVLCENISEATFTEMKGKNIIIEKSVNGETRIYGLID